jgi:predicted amidophosphoribosyltransferase
MTLTVSNDLPVMEDESIQGKPLCPSCKGVLRPWGSARVRTVRTISGVTNIRPRRTRCASCSKTHVLIPDKLLLRRVDEVDVIGSALLRSSLGDRYNKIATAISRPLSTVRGWIRRFRAKAEMIRQRLRLS